MSSPRIAFLDIESAPNVGHIWSLWNQNVSLAQLQESARMLSFAVKWRGERKVEFHSEFNFETGELDQHSQMVQAAWDVLDRADILVTYNGDKFDIPHLNTEIVRAGLEPPSPFKSVDLLKAVKRHFRFPSNKLEYVANALGLGGKVKHEGHELWVKCLAGDPAAWKRFRTYNKRDVVLNESVYDALLPRLTGHPHMGLYGDCEDCCQKCGNKDLERRGLAYTPLGAYQQYRCKSCGGWSRGKKALKTVDIRQVAGA